MDKKKSEEEQVVDAPAAADTAADKTETSPDETAVASQKEKKKISTTDKLKFAGLIVFILIIIGLTLALVPYFGLFTSEEGRQELIDLIQDAGITGVGICLALQFLQIVVAFIPGEVVQIAIGAVYGTVGGTLIIVLGALISSAFVFFVVRKLGAPFVDGMIGPNSKIRTFLQKDRRLSVLVFILYLIPGLPKDIFTYLFPLTPIRPANFLILSTLARTPAIAASAFFGNAAIQGDYTEAIIVGIVAGGLGLLGILFNQKIMDAIDRVEDRLKARREKNKATKEEN